MRLLLSLILNTLALIVTAYIVPGFSVANWKVALLAAIVLGLVNTFIRPVLIFLTIPLNLLTFGLFTFVVNAIMLWLVSLVVSGVMISGWLSAVIAAFVLSLVATVLSTLVSDVTKIK